MVTHVDAIVIGAGVIGLAVARALTSTGREVILIERERASGQHASSRNSEVLHAGLYYPPGSLKARLCVPGRAALVRYCEQRGLPHAQPGKLIVATTPAQQHRLHEIHTRAVANGVEGLCLLDAADVRRREPTIEAVAALHSPCTGIIDSHSLMRSLWSDAEAAGASLALATSVRRITETAGQLRVTTDDFQLDATIVVNAAGLGAQAIARNTEGLPSARIPPRYLLKGTYFTLAGQSPWSHLIYPVPDTASLGVHVTLDLHGNARFGPDQEWIDAIDYTVDPGRASTFARAIRAYYPDLDPQRLRPAYAGIRAKIQGPDDPPADFVIEGPADHGIDGLCNLFGIESPGLTSCLAIADHVLHRLALA